MGTGMEARLTTAHRGSDAARGLFALLGVVVLVAGVPVALILWVGWPLPAEMPTVSQVSDALRDTYIPDEFLVKTLAVVCWIVWVELVASLIVEATAYVRGRRAGVVPLAGGVQKAAARLVATIALLGALVSTKGLPDALTDQRRPLVLFAQPVPTQVEATPAAPSAPVEATPTVPAAPAPVYEVQRRDTLWDIAERHLADPLRWPEIFQLNQGRPQPDGRSLIDPDLIYPGWRLDMPADAVGLAPPPPPSQGSAPGPESQQRTQLGEAATPGPAAPSTNPMGSTGMELLDDEDLASEPLLVSETGSRPPAAAPPGPLPAPYDPDAMVLLPEEDSP